MTEMGTAGMHDPLDLLLTRRSVGRVRPDPVPRAIVEQMLAAAVRAPNHHQTEPWRFVVLTGPARSAVGAAHAAAITRRRPDVDPDALAGESRRLDRAPVVIACIVSTTPDDQVRAREDRDAVAASVQNLLLAAHARGLAAIWRTGAMVDESEVRAALGVAASDAIVAFVYVGHPQAPLAPRAGRPLDGIVEWRGE